MKTDLNQIKVADVMSKNVFTVSLQHTWLDAARKMSAKNIHHLVVVDENHIPVIVMSVTDFLKIALNENQSILHEKIEDMKPHNRLISIKPDAFAYDAVNEMNIHLVESVIVLNDEGKLVVIVTAKDLMNAIFFDEKFKE